MKENLKTKRGITLIALIISIIILLILATVTIRILMNQGIIKHAQNATVAYKNAEENETRQLDLAEEKMSQNYKNKELSNEENLLRKYFLGDGSIKKNLFTMYDFVNNGFKDDVETIGDASTSILALGFDWANGGIWVKYKDAAYKVALDSEWNTEDLQLVFTKNENGKEGTIIRYSSDGTSNMTDWMVLYDNGSTVDIVSVDTMGSITLGVNDPQATNDRNEQNTNLGKAINSYNNAVDRLNNYCKSLITNPTAQKVRCLGSKSDYSSDTGKYYFSDTIKGWNSTYNGVGKEGDSNADEDMIRLAFYGGTDEEPLKYAKTREDYWLASRLVAWGTSNGGESTYCSFDIWRGSTTGGKLIDADIWMQYAPLLE